MKHHRFTTFLASLTLVSATYALPAETDTPAQPAKKPAAEVKAKAKVKLEAIESAMTLAELQENIFFREPMCRAASVGIASSFGAQGTGVIVSKGDF